MEKFCYEDTYRGGNRPGGYDRSNVARWTQCYKPATVSVYEIDSPDMCKRHANLYIKKVRILRKKYNEILIQPYDWDQN